MKHKILGLLAVGLLTGPGVASAVPIDSSVATFVTVRECEPGSTPCDFFGVTIAEGVSGHPGDGLVAATVSSPTWGTTTSSAELSGVAGAPILRNYVVSEAGYRLSTNTGALQRYTYTGTEVAARTFGGTLTYSQFLPDWNLDCPEPEICRSGIIASILAFTTTADFLVSGESDLANFVTISSGYRFAPGFTLLAENVFSDYNDATTGFAQLSLNLMLNPGDTFWVRVFLQTPSSSGAIINSSNTFVTSFDDPTNLVPAQTVPEPRSLALLGLGLFGLGLTRRRAN